MNKLLSITVKGRNNKYSFNFYGDPKYLEEWRKEGLEIDEVINTVPEWVLWWLISFYILIQDLFNFKVGK